MTLTRTTWLPDSPRDGEYEAWMVSATWGKDLGGVPSQVAGYFYTAKHGVIDETTARAMAEKCSAWESSPTIRIWHRHIPQWEEVT